MRAGGKLYRSRVKTKPGAKIKGVVLITLPLSGVQGTDHTFANHNGVVALNGNMVRNGSPVRQRVACNIDQRL